MGRGPFWLNSRVAGALTAGRGGSKLGRSPIVAGEPNTLALARRFPVVPKPAAYGLWQIEFWEALGH